jgi:hypothetical protein
MSVLPCRPRSLRYGFVAVFVSLSSVSVFAQAADYWINPDATHFNNGGDLKLSVQAQTGFYFDGTEYEQANFTGLVAPSDVVSQWSYDSTFWSGIATTQLAEAVATRQELLKLRRFVVLLGGIFFGVELMKYLFRQGGL